MGVNLDEEIIKQLKIIAAREGINLKELHKRWLEEAVKKHGDGNPAFTLDQWQDKSMMAVPAVFRDIRFWTYYINNIESEKYFRQLETQIYSLKELLDKRWVRGF